MHPRTNHEPHRDAEVVLPLQKTGIAEEVGREEDRGLDAVEGVRSREGRGRGAQRAGEVNGFVRGEVGRAGEVDGPEVHSVEQDGRGPPPATATSEGFLEPVNVEEEAELGAVGEEIVYSAKNRA